MKTAWLKEAIRREFRARGLEVGGYRHTYLARRQRLFESLGVELLVDVGANDGRYVKEVRLAGYQGAAISYEPASAPFEALRHRARSDSQWEAIKVAVGQGAVRSS